MTTKIEYKTLKFEMKKFEEDEDFFKFEGYLSTWEKDRGDDVFVKGAFAESLSEHEPSLFWAHKSHEPLGVFDSLKEDAIGLYVHGRMPKADSFVRDRIIPQMKIGSIKSMSVGFSIPDYEKNVDYADGIRFIKKAFLWEGSLVTIPMNAGAVVKEVKKIEIGKDLSERDLEKAFREGIRVSRSQAKMLVSFVKAGFACDAKKAESVKLEKGEWSDILKSVEQISK